ncbi:hypothetical protein LIER_37089 [Lithospermum erythrorhizon]|uniref:ATP-dependent DNA helicase n=1 Tax=Lithospermum erythrorhizon TaxID=34254 RepID=A0AAV3PH65_LITER
MIDKSAIKALDKLLQDLCENTEPFGKKLVVFGGDFRQYYQWLEEEAELSKLTDNMRARNDPGFIEFLMKIGNGEERVNCQGQIPIQQPMCSHCDWPVQRKTCLDT